MEAYNNALFTSHIPLIWGLYSLIIGSSCNKSGFTMNMEKEQGSKRASIAAYETSPAGVTLLKKFEGLRTEPYICPGGTLTVGFGQTISRKEAYSISASEAEAMLHASLSKTYAPDIKRLVKVPLSQREFDTLVSLDYNIGATILNDPTKDIKNNRQQIAMLPLLNASCYEEASLEFPKFTKGGPEKKYYRGLLKRRMAEMFVFRNSASVPEALRVPIEDDNFRKITKCDSIAKYWEESGQQNLRDEAILLYKAYNDQSEAFEAEKCNTPRKKEGCR
jgi:lysozyme